jgi:hypothetical protein
MALRFQLRIKFLPGVFLFAGTLLAIASIVILDNRGEQVRKKEGGDTAALEKAIVG